ncbi:MAG: putative transposase, partial [Nitriliruptoraceae bacterium]
MAGRKKKLRLAEATLKLAKDFKVREVRCLDESGKQISIVTTRQDLSPGEVASRLFARWRQENFFRYMRHEFALDHLPTQAVEPADADRLVPNPARKAREQELKALRAELARVRSALGQALEGDPKNAPVQELREQIATLQAAIATAKEERGELPEKVPLRELLDE